MVEYKYKGYVARVELTDGLLYGDVVNIKDTIVF